MTTERPYTLWVAKCPHGNIVGALAAGLAPEHDATDLGEWLLSGLTVERVGLNATPVSVTPCESCKRGAPVP